MRALSTCLSVILGVSVCYLAACSSDSDAGGGGGAAGEAGESSSAGSSGKAGSGNTAGANSSGAAGVAGDTGAAGAAGAPGGACAFESTACTSCLTKKCSAEVGACAAAADCGGALDGLDACACGGEKTALMCETAFIADGGTAAQPLVDCFNQNCASVCAM